MSEHKYEQLAITETITNYIAFIDGKLYQRYQRSDGSSVWRPVQSFKLSEWDKYNGVIEDE